MPKIEATHTRVTNFLKLTTVALLTLAIAGCRTTKVAEKSSTSGASVGFAGSISGLFYPGYIRAFSRTESPCPDTRLGGPCWVEVAKNTGPGMSQFGLKIRSVSRDAKNPSELLLNLETGEIVELVQKQTWKAPQQGGSFYEYTAKLQTMIEMLAKSKTVFPIEYVASVLDSLNEATDLDGVRAESFYAALLRGQANKMNIDYKAKETRDIVLQFWTKKKLLSEKRISVAKGTARLTAEVDIPTEVSDVAPSRILVSLVAKGGAVEKAIAAAEVPAVFSKP